MRKSWGVGVVGALAAWGAAAHTLVPGPELSGPAPGIFTESGGGLKIEASATRATIQVAEPTIDETLTLTNQGPDGYVELGGLENGATKLKTEWRRADGSAITGPVQVARGGILVVGLMASAPRSGTYRSRVRLLDAAGRELWAGYISIDRRAALPTAGAMQPAGAPFEQTIGLWRRPVEFTFALRNPTSSALAVEPPQVLELRRETSGRWRSVVPGVSKGGYVCPQPTGGAPGGRLSTSAVVLAPQASCLGLVTAYNDWAGAYVATVAVSGTDGGQAVGDVQVNVRLAWYWAALTTAAGSIGGWVVGTFRREWRARSLLAEAAALQRERLARISRRAQANGQGEVTAPTVQAVEDLIEQIQRQGDLDGVAEALAAQGARIERLDRWQTLEAHVAGSPDADSTKGARQALRDALQDPATTDAELTARFADVTHAAVNAAPAGQARAAMAGASVPSMPPPPSGLDAPMAASRTSDAAALIASRRKRIELIVNAVAGAALIASAVQAVWANDPTWGDLTDILGLLITAFAVQAGGSVALGQWSGAYRGGGAPAPPLAAER